MSEHTTEPTPAQTPHKAIRQLPTPRFLDEHVLAPSMDATCHNLDQHNPDPEPNSILEFMGTEIQALQDGPRKQRLTILLNAAIESNNNEGSQNRAISGDIDQAIHDLRAVLATGTTVKHRNVHELVRELRTPLEILRTVEKHPARRINLATEAVDRIIAQTPKHRLLSASVLHNLGKGKAAVLIERCER